MIFAPTLQVPAPTSAQVAALEARYTPPRWSGRTAGSPSDYARSYWRDPSDPDMILGQYTSFGAGREVRLLSGPPARGFVADGGCGVVNIRYRLSTQVLQASCGGR